MKSKETQFKTGNSGGPGRPKGSKNKITKAFLKALTEDFAEHGVGVIKLLREKDPGLYLRIVAQLVPKDLDVKHSGDVIVNVVKYADEQADSERSDLDPSLASNGSGIPISL